MSFSGKLAFIDSSVLIKAQPESVQTSTGSETLATTTAEAGNLSEIIEDSSEGFFLEPVKDFKLETPESLKNEIQQYKGLHLRPMSQKEYDRLVKTLKDQVSETGKPLYRYEIGAIARVIKENFEKWFPSVALDYQVDSSLEFLYEVDHILDTQYHEALEKYRDPFTLATAEEVSELYTLEEIQRLRGLGVAFLDDSYKNLTSNAVVQRAAKIFKPVPVKYLHPMLKYNLLKDNKSN